MSLQDWFYAVAIIFMILLIGVTIFIGVVFYLLYQRFISFQEQLSKQLRGIVQPTEAVFDAGAKVAKTASNKIKSILKK